MSTRTNLMANPSLETGTTNWTAAGPVTQTRVNTQAASGSWSLRHVTTGGSAQGFGTSTPGGTNAPGNVPYSLSFAIKGTGNITNFRLIAYYVGGGNIDKDGTAFAIPANWGRFKIENLVPDPTKTINFFGVSVLTTEATDFYVDAVLIEASATTDGYFDGDSDNAVWTGTPHASTSVLTLPDTARTLHPVLKIGSSYIGPMRVGERN